MSPKISAVFDQEVESGVSFDLGPWLLTVISFITHVEGLRLHARGFCIFNIINLKG